jgi:hypothetical protein
MRLRCDAINYYTRGGADSEGIPTQRPAASVTFSFADPSPVSRPIDGFSINFIDLEEPIDYFPGKIYNLTLEEVVEN